MKKLILTLGIILTGLFAVNAQQSPGVEKQTDKMMATYNDVCQLTPAQADSIRPMVENFISTRQANKQQYGNDRASLAKADKENRRNYMAQLKTVLTPDQQQKLKAYQQQRRQERQQRRQNAPQPQGTPGGQ